MTIETLSYLAWNGTMSVKVPHISIVESVVQFRFLTQYLLIIVVISIICTDLNVHVSTYQSLACCVINQVYPCIYLPLTQ